MDKDKQDIIKREAYITQILNKLTYRVALEQDEIDTVSRALREANHAFQIPYYEIVYHDEYNNTERRVMNPVSSYVKKGSNDDCMIREDYFDVTFRRLINKKESASWKEHEPQKEGEKDEGG